uniref:Uncharacterized protein n=1 Tax=Oryza sativa subsp. japonica TaxID=39947 RepID=Q6K9D6_ORYSJ|nr:hypothetical protein [Oryza sativa Japonica Group]
MDLKFAEQVDAKLTCTLAPAAGGPAAWLGGLAEGFRCERVSSAACAEADLEVGTLELYRAAIAEFVVTLLFQYETVTMVIRHKHQDAAIVSEECGGVSLYGVTWAFGGIIQDHHLASTAALASHFASQPHDVTKTPRFPYKRPHNSTNHKPPPV